MLNPYLDLEMLKNTFSFKNYKNLVIDCVGFFVLNCIQHSIDPVERILEVVDYLKEQSEEAFIVSNEISMAPVAPDSFTRKYLKILGETNEKLAKICDQSYLIVAGQAIPL